MLLLLAKLMLIFMQSHLLVMQKRCQETVMLVEPLHHSFPNLQHKEITRFSIKGNNYNPGQNVLTHGLILSIFRNIISYTRRITPRRSQNDFFLTPYPGFNVGSANRRPTKEFRPELSVDQH